MAVGKFNLVDNAIENIMNGNIDLDADNMTAVLLDATSTWNALDDTFSDISADEIADAGYAQVAISGQAVTQIANGAKFDCNDVDFGNAVTITAKWLYIVVGTAGALGAGSLLLGGMDLDDSSGAATQSSTNGDFDVAIHADGAFDVVRT